MNKAKIETIVLSDSWLKAIVIGSLWASFEIVVGSFLHNMRMPFAGTILSAFAVIFLVSIYQIWPERWIILRAGIICALMKSISPSAVIFGPMIGIFSEALILELTVILLGKNLFSYMIGGGLAVFSAILHKAANLILLYSFDLINVYVNIVEYASDRLSLPAGTPGQILMVLSSIYIIIGFISAIIGFFIGKKAKTLSPDKRHLDLKKSYEEEANPHTKYSRFLLLAHISLLAPGLWFLSQDYNFFLKLSILSAYIIFSLLRYKNLIRRLLKPLFWVQLLVILILASLFLEYSKDEFSWSFALYSGFTMLLRAVFVIICFSSISREIVNPIIKNFLLRKGNVSLKIYYALQTGFMALPIMIENYSELKLIYKKPLNSFVRIISEAENWLETIKYHQKNNS